MDIIVVDDEQNVRQTLIKILQQEAYDLNYIGQAGTVKEAVQLIHKHNPDILFLDVELTDGTGFDILAQFENPSFKVIFITAYQEYALRAFKFSALDYILKPFDPEDIDSAMAKVTKAFESENLQVKLKAFLSNIENISREVKKIVLNTSESIHLVSVQDIIRCQSDGNYTRFFLQDRKNLLVSKTLKQYDEMLTPYGFFRVHQSHLVNLNFLDFFNKDNERLVLKDSSAIPVSTRRKDQLISILNSL
mgnify:CR=1 FL=1